MSALGELRAAYQTPWKIRNELWRQTTAPLSALFLWMHGVRSGRRCRIYGLPIVQRHRGSSITLDDSVQLRSWRSSNPLTPAHPVALSTRSATASITIGRGSALTGTTIVAEQRIDIGARVTIGSDVAIVDTDFHSLDPFERAHGEDRGVSAAVTIEDDVFIGMRSIVLKGVRIGRGSVVGAGSVVSSSIAPFTIVAGNPARPVGSVREKSALPE